MSESSEHRDPDVRAQKLLQAGAIGELRLLKRERKAEQRLAKFRAALAEDLERLRKLQGKVDQSLADVAAAEAAVREAQALRAAGPPSSTD